MINGFIDDFLIVIESGMDNLQPYTTWFMASLIVVNITILGVKIALGEGADLPSVSWKLLSLSILIWFINNFDNLGFAFTDTLIDLSGRAIPDSFNYVYNPDELIKYASTELVEPLQDKLPDTFKIRATGDYITFIIAWVIIVLVFTILTVQIVLAHIELYILMMYSLILLPFMILDQTKFIGSKPIGVIVGAGIKLGILNLVTGIGVGIYRAQLQVPNTLTMGWLMRLIVLSLILAYVAVQIPALASSLLSGVPNLGAAGLFQNSAAMSGAAGAFTMRGKIAAIQGARLGGRTVNAVRNMTNSYSSRGSGGGSGGQQQSMASVFRNAQNRQYQSEQAQKAGSAYNRPSGGSQQGASSRDFRPPR